MTAAPNIPTPTTITFPNSNQAALVRVKPRQTPEDILEALGISKASGVIILCGSTGALDSRLQNRVRELLSRGVAKAAAETGALIIDGGTMAGVIELMGMGVADRGRKTSLLGVAPSDKVSYPEMPAAEGETSRTALDPNHSHFVIVEGERWGGETEMMFQLAKAAAAEGAPVVTILAGGGITGITMNEALATVRNGWPLLILEGTERLADRIAGLLKRKKTIQNRKGGFWKFMGRVPGFGGLTEFRLDDPLFSEIINDGKPILFPRRADANQLRQDLKLMISPPPSQRDDLLNLAWRRFAEYDLNSLRHRNTWYKLKNVPLYLGVISTLLVLIYSVNTAVLTSPETTDLWGKMYNGFMVWMTGIRENQFLNLFFRFAIIMLPISTSVVMGIETRFKLGSKYILLRGAAEAAKRGIYSLRALSGVAVPYDQLPYDNASLSKHLERVSKILLESDVNEAAFKPYTGSIPPSMYGAEAYDDGRSHLKPQEYIRIRIGDQIKFFTLRTNQFEKRLRTLQVWILVLGGIGTLLAALEAQYWLPFTAAIVSAMTAFLEYRQIDQTLVKYNLTKSSLENIQSRWEGLTSAEQKKDENIFNLVREVEAILESENQGWVQYVQQAQETQKMTSEEEDLVEEELGAEAPTADA